MEVLIFTQGRQHQDDNCRLIPLDQTVKSALDSLVLNTINALPNE